MILEDLSFIFAIVGSVAGAAFFISKKLTCSERASDKAIEAVDALEELIDKETQHADDIHRRLFDKIDEIRDLIIKNGKK